MVVIGAKGFAKEVLEILHGNNQLDHLVFYDDVNEDIGDYMYSKFPILKNMEQVKEHFLNFGNNFTIAFGKPALRRTVYKKFVEFGGIYTSTISPQINVGSYDINFGDGCNILSNSTFSNSVTLGIGCMVYYNVIVTHDCVVGDFVEISPGATLLGNVHVDSYTQIGSNATILPNVTVGRNVIIGAGAVVATNIPDNCVVVGVPAKVIKEIKPLKF